MKDPDRATKQVEDLLYQALETEIGGAEIYRMALLCAKHPELKEEWTKYHAQTVRHIDVVRGVLDALGLDPEATTPGRLIVREKGKALVCAIQKALKDAPQAAEIVAAECLVDAETKDHANWQLIGALAERATGATKTALMQAYEEVEDEEDEHLYHTKGWCRELALEALGLPAVLPPPEEELDVKSAEEAARAAKPRGVGAKKRGRGDRRPHAGA
jgi:rubrerythrin